MFNFLTEAATQTENMGLFGSNGGMGFTTIITLLAMLAAFYFLMIRPEKKRKQEAEELRSNLKVGDEIVTVGGVCGKVVHIKDDKFVIETGADQVRVEFMRFALSTNETANKRAQEEAKRAAEAKARAKAEKKAAKGK